MARPKSVTGTVRQVVRLPTDVAVWLDMTVFSIDLGRSPLGAKSKLVGDLLRAQMTLAERDGNLASLLRERRTSPVVVLHDLLRSLGYAQVADFLADEIRSQDERQCREFDASAY